jgi:hypothetical protein
MQPDGIDVHVAIISSGRPGNAPAMEQHVIGGGLPRPMWYVAAGEAPDYRYCGATYVIEAGPLCVARNVALEEATRQGLPCVQLSDDLRRVGWANGTKAADVEPITLGQAVQRMLDAMAETGAMLAGGAPTANPYFSRPGVHRSAFIVGDLIVVRTPTCGLRFDEKLRLKEDYDYTLQHLATFGRVARVGQLLPVFAHRTNKGGAVAVRTPELEDETIDYLMAKWPGQLRPNSRRPHEILLRWRPPAK